MDGKAVFLIAPPGGGKGTQAVRLERENFHRVEMSAVLKSRVPKTVGTIGGSGLVDSTTVIEALRDHTVKIPIGEDLVIDGFPRTEAQARFAVTYFGERHVTFIIMEVSDEICEARVANRYLEDMRRHLEEGGPPPRSSDAPEIHRDRLKIYRREMVELEDYLMHHVSSNVHYVPGNLSSDDVARIIRTHIFSNETQLIN